MVKTKNPWFPPPKPRLQVVALLAGCSSEAEAEAAILQPLDVPWRPRIPSKPEYVSGICYVYEYIKYIEIHTYTFMTHSSLSIVFVLRPSRCHYVSLFFSSVILLPHGANLGPTRPQEELQLTSEGDLLAEVEKMICAVASGMWEDHPWSPNKALRKCLGSA